MGTKPFEQFGLIDYGKLYKSKFPEKFQRITERKLLYDFDSDKLKDYNYLLSRFNQEFFNLPYFIREISPIDVGRPDLISYEVYGDTDFWHLILIFNNIADPIYGIIKGKDLKIPMFDQLSNWLINALLHSTKTGI